MQEAIHKKVLAKYFNQIIAGNKTFEFRKIENEDKYIVGKSNFILHEVDNKGSKTGRICRCKITSFISAEEINTVCCENCITNGYALIGIRPVAVYQEVEKMEQKQ